MPDWRVTSEKETEAFAGAFAADFARDGECVASFLGTAQNKTDAPTSNAAGIRIWWRTRGVAITEGGRWPCLRIGAETFSVLQTAATLAGRHLSGRVSRKREPVGNADWDRQASARSLAARPELRQQLRHS